MRVNGNKERRTTCALMSQTLQKVGTGHAMHGASTVALNGVMKAAEIRVRQSGMHWGQEATRWAVQGSAAGAHAHLRPSLSWSLVTWDGRQV